MIKLNEIYYKTVYQFSKSNMIKLFEHPHFNLLFTFYFESGTFASFCQEDSTLRQNKESYMKAGQEFLE